ncbi:GNAT family N-acetyltransferase [Metabacillus sp. HB246100]|uniref:GNAT family N-acetyltransferase n=1 Tax=Bacillus weihaiensis TaxID=1547283 RepID=UPI002354D36B|nr:GNAT family N-acetyltransferase [Bacillus weihaiensis]
MGEVKELTTLLAWKEAFPVMKQLRSDIDETSYLTLLNQMRNEGYRLFALYVEKEIVALAGFSLKTNFYQSRHVFLYDLITDENHRSKGYGEKLLTFVHKWAKEHGAEYVALESGIHRTEAHRFYQEKFTYDKWCYSFRRRV